MSNQGFTPPQTGKKPTKQKTDEHFTPPAVYEAVLSWARQHLPIQPEARIVRPFWPGEYYTRYPYQPGDVVVDNPPFSILMEITRWYNERGIPYLLFAHPATSAVMHSTLIVTENKITYQSGLEVQTSFITNMLGDTALITAPDLREAINNAIERAPRFKSYTYPECVLRISEAGMMVRRGIRISIGRDECAVVRNIGGHHLMGLSYVLTDAAIDRLRHVRQRIDRPGAIPIQLSPEQEDLVRKLDKSDKETPPIICI